MTQNLYKFIHVDSNSATFKHYHDKNDDSIITHSTDYHSFYSANFKSYYSFRMGNKIKNLQTIFIFCYKLKMIICKEDMKYEENLKKIDYHFRQSFFFHWYFGHSFFIWYQNNHFVIISSKWQQGNIKNTPCLKKRNDFNLECVVFLFKKKIWQRSSLVPSDMALKIKKRMTCLKRGEWHV